MSGKGYVLGVQTCLGLVFSLSKERDQGLRTCFCVFALWREEDWCHFPTQRVAKHKLIEECGRSEAKGGLMIVLYCWKIVLGISR